jgi:hypothetical protein
MIRHPRSVLPLVALIPALAILPGCGGAGRVTTFPAESAPTATSSQTMVRVTEAVRRPGELELALTIANPTADSVVFTRKYGEFSAASVVHGDIRVVGERTPTKSRTFPPDRYTVLAGEEAALRLVFRAADLDRADNLTLHVVGSTHGAEQSWTIPIPPEPSRPAMMASNY